jgi:hypothetical protein
MCAADEQLKSDMAEVNELIMNFTSGQVGGAQDYHVSLFCLADMYELTMNFASGRVGGAQDYQVSLFC